MPTALACDFKVQGRRSWLHNAARSVKLFLVHGACVVSGIDCFDIYTSAFLFRGLEVSVVAASFSALAASSVVLLLD